MTYSRSIPEAGDVTARSSGGRASHATGSDKNKSTLAPALGSLRSLAARVIVAELWLGIGAVAMTAALGDRDFAVAIAFSTVFALLPSLVWVCDPVGSTARCLLSVGLVAQCALLALMSLHITGPVTYGIFAFSLVLLAQIAGFICWRSLLLAGGFLVAMVIAAGYGLSAGYGGAAGSWISGTAETIPIFSDGTLFADLVDGLLPLWLLVLGVLLPMTYRVERALDEAHSSRLAALQAMTFAVEEARANELGKRPSAHSAAAALNLRRAVMSAGLESEGLDTENQVSKSGIALSLPGDAEMKRYLMRTRDRGCLSESEPGESRGVSHPDNPVHRQHRMLARRLETRDFL
jgi:hypothetical protein